LYTYSASVLYVHDGDGLELNVDLGFDTWHRGAFRLHGLNARELSQPGGLEAREHLAALLPYDTHVIVSTIKPDKYGGRWGCHLQLPDGTDLAALLVAGQWAAPWSGRGVKPVPAWPRQGDQ
jgi:endonuclease YncB( thermonuclease family)